jgi:hypothetical protein
LSLAFVSLAHACVRLPLAFVSLAHACVSCLCEAASTGRLRAKGGCEQREQREGASKGGDIFILFSIFLINNYDIEKKVPIFKGI